MLARLGDTLAGLAPTLTVGVPVHNGALYLEEAVESVLSQSFRDLEMIISDNASNDDTEAIGRALAARDPRVTYRRNAANVGLAANFNLLVPLACGRLFKWASADDVLRPGHLERCVAVIEADPTVVLVYAKTDFVDGDGAPLYLEDPGWHLVSDDPSERLAYAIRAGHWVNALNGVIRTDALRRTRLEARYPGGDYRLMAELSLLGKFVEIPERLFVRRIHLGSSKGHPHDAAWLRRHVGGSRTGQRCGYWRLSAEYAGIVMRAPIPLSRKGILLTQVALMMGRRRTLLLHELGELFRA
jgi:glycosyltransferase involved in cell wall biosynthesis